MASIASTITFFLSFLVLMLLSNAYEPLDEGFNLELIHRDSPLSLFYNPLDTHSNRVKTPVHHSFSSIRHAHRSSSKPGTFQSDVISGAGSYYTKISVSTPPFEVVVVVDTGSSLLWIQCKPCKNCFKQNTPIFDSSKSSTYKDIPCKSNYCKKIEEFQGSVFCENTSSKICLYDVSYQDNSYSLGGLAADTLTFSSATHRPISLGKIVLGCGHNNSLFGAEKSPSTGILGINYGPDSLISQLGLKKFSYCLVPLFLNLTSTLKFGSHATISGKGIVSTPMIQTSDDVQYYMSLEGISVGNKRFSTPVNVTEGNIINDCGTTLTFLPSRLYTMVATEVKKSIKFKTSRDPLGVFQFCYKVKYQVKVPKVRFHFTGADLELKRPNILVPQTDDFECFTMAPHDVGPIFGNLVQINFQVEYDLERKKISFAPADCTSFRVSIYLLMYPNICVLSSVFPCMF